MQIGFIGLGKMGGNMALRLAVGSTDAKVKGTHAIVGFARDPNPDLAAVKGITLVDSIQAMIAQLTPPRAVWVMVPAGNPTESVITDLAERLTRDDLIVDGGNSYYKDTLRRAEALGKRQIGFLDVGTSGGIWGRQEGYCMMVGGEPRYVERLRPILDTLAPPDGWEHMGGHGAGHFVKMVHNGIEYGLMESYGEGFEILDHSEYEFDLHQISGIWRYGSVVRSWLLELLHSAFEQHGSQLDDIAPYVEDSGEGPWTLDEAIQMAGPGPGLAALP